MIKVIYNEHNSNTATNNNDNNNSINAQLLANTILIGAAAHLAGPRGHHRHPSGLVWRLMSRELEARKSCRKLLRARKANQHLPTGSKRVQPCEKHHWLLTRDVLQQPQPS